MIATTKQQSARLLALGISPDTADMAYRTITEPHPAMDAAWKTLRLLALDYDEAKTIYGDEASPVWSLSALLERVLPQNIDGEPLDLLRPTDGQWSFIYGLDYDVDSPDPIEACVLMAEKLHEKGLLK